jgi:glycosyltransferase involved in cell wall biosynthesis
MMVGIDAGPLLGQRGISGYVSPLVRSLLKIDPDTHYRLFLRRGWLKHHAARSLAELAPVVPIHVPDRILSFWWDHLGWTLPVPRRLWRTLDLFLATCLVVPVIPRGKVVSIVYDLIPLRLPELFADHRAFRLKLERLIHRSSAVVAISQRTKQDLVEMLAADERSIRVIYPGCGEAFRPVSPSAIAEVAGRYGIKGRYILYVGAFGPHKNVPTLLRAYQWARLEGGLRTKLVLVVSSSREEETKPFLETLHVRDDIVLTGYIAAEDLPALYAGADLFVFPSQYEGFGLPVLEAMACGTPVIVSNRGALPEVAGEAGLYVDPENLSALAEAMCTVASDQTIRARMANAGLKQAARFSWTRSAAEMLALFREVVDSKADDA